MPIIVRHDGSPLLAGLDAAAGAAGNAIAGRSQGMGGLNDMLMRLAQAQIAERANRTAFDRNLKMAEIEDRMIRSRQKEGFDRSREAEAQDRDREMQEAAALAIAYGSEHGVFPPAGLTTRRDVENWASGLRADKEWNKRLMESDRQQSIRQSEKDIDRAREKESVQRVAPQVLPDFYLRPETPQTFDELRMVYADRQNQEDRADTDRRIAASAVKQRESEDRLRYVANVQALSKQGEILQGLIQAAGRELASLKDPQFGGIAQGMEERARELATSIKQMQSQTQEIAKAITALSMGAASQPAAAAAAPNLDAIIQEMVLQGMSDEKIEAELRRMGLQ
jgi:hypothetical protein